MLAFALDAIADLRRSLFLFDDFHESKWLLYALFRLTFPVPVKLNRFLDELCDFSLGIFIPPCLLLIITLFIALFI